MLNCFGLDMIERCLLILLAVTLVGSMGGFFLYVPILPALTVTVMLGGLCAMFWLGVRVGRRPLADTRVEEGQGNQLSVL
jgi:hypothetical protein